MDIPDETDPDHERYHGVRGTVVAVLKDDAGRATGDERDSLLYRVELEDGDELDFGTYSPAAAPGSSLFRAELECPSGTVHVHPVSIQKDGRQVTFQYLSESEDGGWGQTATMDERHDVLPAPTVGYAVYVYYDTFAS